MSIEKVWDAHCDHCGAGLEGQRGFLTKREVVEKIKTDGAIVVKVMGIERHFCSHECHVDFVDNIKPRKRKTVIQ